MADRPAISVVIPVFNGAENLGAAITSALAQIWTPAEIIVVDDGSTDSSARVAQGFGERVRLLQLPNSGPGEARNNGALAARGELLAFLDHDDLWPDTSLAVRAAALAADPTLDAAFGRIVQFRDETDIPVINSAVPEVCYLPGAMLVRRAAFLHSGMFPTDLAVGEFIDWFMRASEGGLRLAMVSQVVLRRRLHAGNMTLHNRAAYADYLRVARSAIRRKRSSEAAD